jgi:DNA polymerase III epsilon subunit-like protein
MENYSFIQCDVETNGLLFHIHSPIEISLIRMSDKSQKTWFLKPIDIEASSPEALKVNGYTLDDFNTSKFEDPNKAIVEIENWLSEDGFPTEYRCLIGHNISFDKYMLESLWQRCDSKDTFPFGRRYLDTMVIELYKDFCKDKFESSYSLHSLTKKYGIKNEKAHSAAADTKATMELFLKQING